MGVRDRTTYFQSLQDEVNAVLNRLEPERSSPLQVPLSGTNLRRVSSRDRRMGTGHRKTGPGGSTLAGGGGGSRQHDGFSSPCPGHSPVHRADDIELRQYPARSSRQSPPSLPRQVYQLFPDVLNARKALLIGLKYKGERRETRTAVEDTKKLASLLPSFGFKGETWCLTDDSPDAEPTRANILQAIRWLSAGASAGDSLFFSFFGTSRAAGPGSSGIAPSNHQQEGVIAEAELKAALLSSLPPGVKLTIFCDCGINGSLFRLPYSLAADDDGMTARESPRSVAQSPLVARPCVVMLSAASREDSDSVAFASGGSAGCLIASFLVALLTGCEATGLVSHRSLLSATRELLRTRYKSSLVPQFSSNVPFDWESPFTLGHPSLLPHGSPGPPAPGTPPQYYQQLDIPHFSSHGNNNNNSNNNNNTYANTNNNNSHGDPSGSPHQGIVAQRKSTLYGSPPSGGHRSPMVEAAPFSAPGDALRYASQAGWNPGARTPLTPPTQVLAMEQQYQHDITVVGSGDHAEMNVQVTAPKTCKVEFHCDPVTSTTLATISPRQPSGNGHHDVYGGNGGSTTSPRAGSPSHSVKTPTLPGSPYAGQVHGHGGGSSPSPSPAHASSRRGSLRREVDAFLPADDRDARQSTSSGGRNSSENGAGGDSPSSRRRPNEYRDPGAAAYVRVSPPAQPAATAGGVPAREGSGRRQRRKGSVGSPLAAGQRHEQAIQLLLAARRREREIEQVRLDEYKQHLEDTAHEREVRKQIEEGEEDERRREEYLSRLSRHVERLHHYRKTTPKRQAGGAQTESPRLETPRSPRAGKGPRSPGLSSVASPLRLHSPRTFTANPATSSASPRRRAGTKRLASQARAINSIQYQTHDLLGNHMVQRRMLESQLEKYQEDRSASITEPSDRSATPEQVNTHCQTLPDPKAAAIKQLLKRLDAHDWLGGSPPTLHGNRSSDARIYDDERQFPKFASAAVPPPYSPSTPRRERASQTTAADMVRAEKQMMRYYFKMFRSFVPLRKVQRLMNGQARTPGFASPSPEGAKGRDGDEVPVELSEGADAEEPANGEWVWNEEKQDYDWVEGAAQQQEPAADGEWVWNEAKQDYDWVEGAAQQQEPAAEGEWVWNEAKQDYDWVEKAAAAAEEEGEWVWNAETQDYEWVVKKAEEETPGSWVWNEEKQDYDWVEGVAENVLPTVEEIKGEWVWNEEQKDYVWEEPQDAAAEEAGEAVAQGEWVWNEEKQDYEWVEKQEQAPASPAQGEWVWNEATQDYEWIDALPASPAAGEELAQGEWVWNEEKRDYEWVPA
ncbi:Metacaspase-1 [Diplonema papillatum]|nr:Metacaspase-1 [Diplonema papillatum]